MLTTRGCVKPCPADQLGGDEVEGVEVGGGGWLGGV